MKCRVQTWLSKYGKWGLIIFFLHFPIEWGIIWMIARWLQS